MVDQDMQIEPMQAKDGDGYDPISQNPDGTQKEVDIIIKWIFMTHIRQF